MRLNLDRGVERLKKALGTAYWKYCLAHHREPNIKEKLSSIILHGKSNSIAHEYITYSNMYNKSAAELDLNLDDVINMYIDVLEGSGNYRDTSLKTFVLKSLKDSDILEDFDRDALSTKNGRQALCEELVGLLKDAKEPDLHQDVKLD